ncbi:MAG: TAXI family TRAP transporter solute-binding subunit [Pseudarthrobacter sp.]
MSTTLTRREALKIIGAGISLGAVPRPARAETQTRLAFATAGKGGVFYPLGSAMATVLSKYIAGVTVAPGMTGGSAENMKLLQQGKVQLALTLADTAWDASQGKLSGWSERVPVRTLLNTYSGYMHIVTLEGLGIKTVADLKGKRLSTGMPGSGTEVKGLRVLEAYGVDPKDFQQERLDYGDAALALKDGKLDAFLSDAGLPGKPIADLAATPGKKVRLLPNGDAVPKMVAKYGPLYFAASIPKGTYQGVDEDVPAAAVANLLVAHQQMDAALAHEITKAILEHTAELLTAHKSAREITLGNAVRGSPIPFHPGALRYYKGKGISVP